MLLLVKNDNDDKSLKLLFDLKKRITPKWKEMYRISCIMQNRKPVLQGNLSDFEYFKLTRGTEKGYYPSIEYIVLNNNKPIGTIYIIMPNPNIADITVFILSDYRNKGYGKAAITIAENILFSNPNIYFTSMRDITPTKITSHMATKLGYIYDNETNTFVKPNPNVNLEKLSHRI